MTREFQNEFLHGVPAQHTWPELMKNNMSLTSNSSKTAKLEDATLMNRDR